MTRTRGVLRRVLPPLLWLAVGIAVCSAAIAAVGQVDDRRGGWALAPLGYAAALGLGQVALLAIAWTLILRRVAATPVGMPVGVRSFLLGWLSRYLPGPPTGPAGKYLATARGGYAPGEVSAALFYEQVLQLGATAAVPALTFPFLFGAGWLWLMPVTATLTAAGALLAVRPAVIRGLGRLASRAGMRSAGDVRPLPLRLLILPGLLTLVASFLPALGFHLVAWTVTSWPLADAGRAVFVFGLASLVGFVIPFLPSGAGAREVVVVGLMGASVGRAGALSSAVIARAVTVLLDAALGLVVALSYAAGPLLPACVRARTPDIASKNRA
jgi:uncharacterized membrane protein YbhN (UPF0104 family)